MPEIAKNMTRVNRWVTEGCSLFSCLSEQEWERVKDASKVHMDQRKWRQVVTSFFSVNRLSAWKRQSAGLNEGKRDIKPLGSGRGCQEQGKAKKRRWVKSVSKMCFLSCQNYI